MDEPTNHLDVEMVEWLEHYFSKENVTLLLVTHDRYFLMLFVKRYGKSMALNFMCIKAIMKITWKKSCPHGK